MNVLVIGKPKYNVMLQVDNYPTEGAKLEVNEKLEIIGGTSCYVACMLAKWGMKVYYAGAIAGDEIGNKIREGLESYNVDTKFMEVDYERKSNINYVILNKSNGSSTEIEHTNEVYLKKYKYDVIPDYIVVDGTDMGACMAAANNYPTAKMIMLANKVNDEFYNLSKRCSYVCANVNFAKALTKMEMEVNRPKALVSLFQKIKDLNKAEYILMLRDKGVLYTKERQVKMIPAITIEKKDDANSGSSFFAAYAYGIINGYDMDEVAKVANIAGALALTKVGSISTIPDKAEVYTMSGLKEGSKKDTQVNPSVNSEPVHPAAPQNQNIVSNPLQVGNQEPVQNQVPNQNVQVNGNASQVSQAPVANQTLQASPAQPTAPVQNINPAVNVINNALQNIAQGQQNVNATPNNLNSQTTEGTTNETL